jgi:hypothetical protein
VSFARRRCRNWIVGALWPAWADGSTDANACLGGRVDAVDYATLDEDLGGDFWKNHSGVAITSDSQQLTLSVTDAYGNSICQNLANLSTSCTFQTGFASTFTIRVDNTQNAAYQLCSF